MPAQLPLSLLPHRGSAPLAGVATFLAPVCWSTPAVVPCGWVGGVFAASLGFLPCAVLFLRACSFPTCRLPWGFLVTGCLSFCFPGDVGWASALPFFSVLLLLRLLAGVGWVMHRVRVLQLRWCLLGLTVRSPCCPSLTLGWVCFWPMMSQAFVGSKAVSAALRGSSSFFCVYYPSPLMGLGWLGHRFVAPPATPGFWTLLMLGCAVLTP